MLQGGAGASPGKPSAFTSQGAGQTSWYSAGAEHNPGMDSSVCKAETSTPPFPGSELFGTWKHFEDVQVLPTAIPGDSSVAGGNHTRTGRGNEEGAHTPVQCHFSSISQHWM